MKPRRIIGRRSFLRSVIGGAMAGTTLTMFGHRAEAQPVDTDTGRHADSGHGVTRLSDMDSGPNADPPGHTPRLVRVCRRGADGSVRCRVRHEQGSRRLRHE
jgi:hypothetical protein